MASITDADLGGEAANDHSNTGDRNETGSSQSKRFRFKSKRRSDRHERSPRQSEDRRHHHRTKRRMHSPSISKDDPSLYDDTHLPNTSSSQYMDPDVAFRESLFDAMADDEGAQFWEGVYGQPIHTYPDVKEGPAGELERMTDEEYTAFVRGKMYEKTHQHLLEEKSRRDAAKKERERLAKEGQREEREAQKFRKKIEESLRRGEERKSKKAWSDRWDTYTKKWEDLGKGGIPKVDIVSIPWPVENGRRKDVTLKEVERFFFYAPTAGQPTEAQLEKILKLERVRWHPDKIQQKLGGQDIEETVIQAVTEVFQIIDHMWSELRSGKG